jgi:hypothetical protein
LAYEVFQRTSVRVDVPVLSIVPGGRVAINAAACRILTQAGIKTVIILWDKDKCKMAVKAAPKGEKNSFTVTFAADLHSGTFAAKSFLQHIGWHATKRETLPTVWNASEKMFELSLPEKYVGAEDKPKRNRFV